MTRLDAIESEDDAAEEATGVESPVLVDKEVIAWRGTSFVPPSQLWLCALLDEIARVKLTGLPHVAIWNSYWGSDPNQLNPENAETPEHRAYVDCFKLAMNREMPWLEPLLNAARTSIALAPGEFTFAVQTVAGITVFPIPELLPYTYLLPWVTPQEAESMH
jgi:hypothetical protein